MLNQENKKSFWSHSVFIFLNRFFYVIAGLLVTFFYAHRLTEVDYGHYQAFWTQLNVFNGIAGLGLAMFTLTYSPEKIRALLGRIKPKYYLFYFLLLTVCSLLFALLQIKNQLAIPWSLLFLAAFALCNISDAFLIAFRKFKPLVFINLIYAVFFFVIHYTFIHNPFDFNGLLAFLLPLLFLKLIVSIWFIFKGGIEIQSKDNEAAVTRGMYSLWRHLYFYDILQIASLWLDKFIVSILMNSEQTATYINGTLNIPFLSIFFSAITGSTLIQLSKNMSTDNKLKLVNQMGRVLSSVAFPICIFFIFFRREFIVFAFSAKYLAAIPIFLSSILIVPFRAYGHTVLLQNMERGKLINQGAILEVVVALVVMYPLYLWMGLPGVALSFVVSTFIQTVFYYFHTKRLLQVNFWALYPIKNWVVKAMGFILLTWGVYKLLPLDWSNTARLFTGLGILAFFSLFSLYSEKNRSKI